MRNNFKRDLKKANKAFHQIKNELLPFIGGGEFIDIEGEHGEEIAKLFDIYAGFDHIQKKDGLLRPIAMRLQPDKYLHTVYRSFTIRYKRPSDVETEWIKRVRAIKHGYLYPYLTIQAYHTNTTINPSLTDFGIIRTKDLYLWAIENESLLAGNTSKECGMRACNEGNAFYWVNFNLLKESGCRIVIYSDHITPQLKQAS